MKPRFLAFPLSIILSSSAMAGQFIWTGATDSNWTTASNWDITAAPPVSTDTFPVPGSTYASDFINIRNNGDLTASVPGTTPGATAVYNPGAGVTTHTDNGRGFVIGTGNGPSATPPNVKGYASLTITSGTIASTRATSSGNEPYMANRADVDLLINGGHLDLSGNLNNFRLIQEGFADVNGPIESTITIASGQLSCNLLDLVFDAEADPATVFGIGTINLDGGVLALTRFGRSAASDPGQTSFTLNLNGGTLRCRNANSNFLPILTDLQALVRAGGAIIDTNGFNNTIAAPLLHDPALGATLDGGITKESTGNLTISGTNTFTGGFTNNGSGNIIPTVDDAFGTGTVTMTAGTIYPTSVRAIANPLSLSNSTLRIGGGSGKSLTWTGPITVAADSNIQADGSTVGVNLAGSVTINSGVTLSATANTNTISGDVGGNGGLTLTAGTLELSGTNTYTGTTTIAGGTLRPLATGTILSSSNIFINGSGNFNVRNTVGWVYNGTITGDGTGSINLNTGTNAELAGNISGVTAINANSTGTNTIVSGNVSGAVALNVQGAAILTLSGDNSGMSGTVSLSAATANTQLNLESATALGTGTLSFGGGTGKIDNPSGGALTLSTNNAQTWNSDFTFVGTNDLNLGTGTVTLGGNRAVYVNAKTLTVGGDISGAFGITKANGGTLALTGSSSYTGSTIVQGGTLKLGAAASIATSTALSINAGATLDTIAQATHTIPATQPVTFGINAASSGTSGKISAAGLDVSAAVVTYNITGTPDDPVYVLATYSSLSGTPSFASVDAPPAGYTLEYAYEGNKIALVQSAVSGYSDWATLNGAGPNLNDDHDGDGVDNGTEFFLGGPAGNTTGFTPLPGVVNTAGTLSVTWPKGAGYLGTYPGDFVVQTSTTLSGAWVDETVGGNVTDSPTEVTYTFPAPLSGKNFVRLKVTGP